MVFVSNNGQYLRHSVFTNMFKLAGHPESTFPRQWLNNANMIPLESLA